VTFWATGGKIEKAATKEEVWKGRGLWNETATLK